MHIHYFLALNMHSLSPVCHMANEQHSTIDLNLFSDRSTTSLQWNQAHINFLKISVTFPHHFLTPCSSRRHLLTPNIHFLTQLQVRNTSKMVPQSCHIHHKLAVPHIGPCPVQWLPWGVKHSRFYRACGVTTDSAIAELLAL